MILFTVLLAIVPDVLATGDGGLTPMLFMDLQDIAPSPAPWGSVSADLLHTIFFFLFLSLRIPTDKSMFSDVLLTVQRMHHSTSMRQSFS